MVLGSVLLGEALTIDLVAGMILVLAGILVGNALLPLRRSATKAGA
jgi:hypothetical protein